ncbi:MAG: hypothetical protein IPM27_08360 [Nitrosomonadales bacterium]|nr:hypothetical protein [Nitrosomonadales bacterium]
MTELCKPEYLEKVKGLTKEESERLLSRMGGKLPRRLQKEKISREEALAMQMELEDEQLEEWRKMMRSLKKKEETKKKEEARKKAKSKPAEKVAASSKEKATKKAATPLKSETATKAKPARKATPVRKAK